MRSNMSKQAFKRAIRNAEVALAEKKAQLPDFEWMQIKHNKKMKLKSLAILAKSLDSLYTNLTGESPWEK